MITPYLSWSLPDVLSTPGSQYASMYNNIVLSLDALLGTQFTPSQININSDLDFQGNDAINVRSVRMANAGSVSNPNDVNCSYVLSGNLWFNDGAGNQIPITNNGNINAAPGNIGGLTGTSASVSFNSVGNAYTFNAAPSRLANLNALSGNFGFINVSGTIQAAQANFTSASYGNIQNLTGSLVQATTVSGGTGNFTTLNASQGNITTISNTALNGTNGTFTQLTSSGGKITSLTATNANIAGTTTAGTVNASNVTSTAATITNLTSSGANLGPVQATTINATGTVTAPTANVTTATATNATLTNITSTGTATLSTATATNATLTNITSAGTSNLGTVNAGSTSVNSLTTTNAATVGTNLTVNNNASVAGGLSVTGDVVAKGGFRQSLGPILVYNSNAYTTPIYATLQYDANAGHATTWYWTAQYAGSIMGFSFSQTGSGTVSVNVIKNSSTLLTISGLSSTGYTTYAKDAYTFNAGDLFTVTYTFSSTSGLAMMGYLTVEC